MSTPTRPASEHGALATEVIDAVNALAGAYDGERALHSKGTVCAGTFTASRAAASLSKASHLQGGEPVRAHVRFSNGGGEPEGRDGAREARGMAVKLYLDDGTTTDLVCVTTPVFVVRTPEDFLELMLARKPDPETGQPDMERLGKFLGAHPEAMPAVQHTLGNPPPVSYLTCAYNSLHAYRVTNAAAEQRFIRYRWEPEAGEANVAEEDEQSLAHDYLRDDLHERLGQGPAAFTLTAAIAADGDPTDDSTAGWPDDRERVALGRLEVTGIATDRERDGDILVFDPTRVTEGIECSGDPILNFRAHAYAESVYRRSGVRRDA
jgi:catalase